MEVRELMDFLTEVQLTVGLQTFTTVISPVPESIIGIDILRSWYNSYIGSLTFGVRAIKVGKAK